MFLILDPFPFGLLPRSPLRHDVLNDRTLVFLVLNSCSVLNFLISVTVLFMATGIIGKAAVVPVQQPRDQTWPVTVPAFPTAAAPAMTRERRQERVTLRWWCLDLIETYK
jgi:hypothetical protein